MAATNIEPTRENFKAKRVSDAINEDSTGEKPAVDVAAEKTLENLWEMDSYLKASEGPPPAWKPLGTDEYSILIAAAAADRDTVLKLKGNLESDFEHVTFDISNSTKARTIILILSNASRTDATLINAISVAADHRVPIFNIGLGGWFDIFGGTWDPILLQKIRDALARLNQTDATTLDPTNPNYQALVRRIKTYVKEPSYRLDGLWHVVSVAEFTFSYSNFTLFITQRENGELEAVDFFTPEPWNGKLEHESFVLTKKLNNGRQMSLSAWIFRPGNKLAAKLTDEYGNIIIMEATHEQDGASGKYKIDGKDENFSIVQKGGGRLLIHRDLDVLAGVKNGTKLIWQFGHPFLKGSNVTYNGKLRMTKYGPVISGVYYNDLLKKGNFVARYDKTKTVAAATVYDVMISYRSTDRQFVDFIQQYLEGNDILCWRDRRMEVGSNWSEDITNAVRTSHSVVCCLSQNYVSSSLCTKEVMLGYEMGKIVVPIVLPQTEKKDNANNQLVAISYGSEFPPHVIAQEIGKATWFDLRQYQNGPDPKNLAEFEARYPSVKFLKQQLTNIKNKGVSWDLSGTWKVVFTQDADGNTLGVKEFHVILNVKHNKTGLSGSGKLILEGENARELDVNVADGASLDSSFFQFSFEQTNEIELTNNQAEDAEEEEEGEDGDEEGGEGGEEEEEGEGEDGSEDGEEEEGDDDEEEEEEEGPTIVTPGYDLNVKISNDGKTFQGFWFAFEQDWCSGEGPCTGTFVKKLDKEKKDKKAK